MIRALYHRFILAYWCLLLARIERRRHGITERYVDLILSYCYYATTSLSFWWYLRKAEMGRLERKQ